MRKQKLKKMTRQEAITTLNHYNKWRRGEEIPQPDPTLIGIAIDKAIELIIKQHHHSTITLEQESELYNHYLKNGESLKYYASKYNISKSTVVRILDVRLKKGK